MTQLNHVPIPTHRPRKQVASEFYAHPYGGIARHIHTTREGFKRFFELDEFDIDVAEAFAGQDQRVFDMPQDEWTQTYGNIGLHPTGRMSYTIVLISKDRNRVGELLKIAPYLWEGVGGVETLDDCDPHGIPRPHDASL